MPPKVCGDNKGRGDNALRLRAAGRRFFDHPPDKVLTHSHEYGLLFTALFGDSVGFWGIWLMARLARCELFDPREVAAVHVMNRVCRRCFLLGDDPISGKNFDHRKTWIENELKRLAASMGIDLLAFACLSNHFHLILRSRPDVVETWSDEEIARRWCRVCPAKKCADRFRYEPSATEIAMIVNCPKRLAEVRLRLSDISWWMRILCQRIAIRANDEDGEAGKFWQSRYRAVRLLDEEALLACAAYVDLNPIRAALAETLETSDFGVLPNF
jgi:REP element-mobilizing transposase RayT